jgi:hypothetical protein
MLTAPPARFGELAHDPSVRTALDTTGRMRAPVTPRVVPVALDPKELLVVATLLLERETRLDVRMAMGSMTGLRARGARDRAGRMNDDRRPNTAPAVLRADLRHRGEDEGKESEVKKSSHGDSSGWGSRGLPRFSSDEAKPYEALNLQNGILIAC